MPRRALVATAVSCIFVGTLGLSVPNSVDWSHTSNSDLVFYGVFNGEQARSDQAKGWLASLRHVGKFTGPVVLATDEMECLLSTLGKTKDATATTESVSSYHDGIGPVFVITISAPARRKADPVMTFASSLTSLRPHLETEEVKLWSAKAFVYMASDIMTGKKLASFIKDVERFRGRNVRKMPNALFLPSPGNSQGKYRTDVAIIFNSRFAMGCLQRWSRHAKLRQLNQDAGRSPQQQTMRKWWWFNPQSNHSKSEDSAEEDSEEDSEEEDSKGEDSEEDSEEEDSEGQNSEPIYIFKNFAQEVSIEEFDSQNMLVSDVNEASLKRCNKQGGIRVMEQADYYASSPDETSMQRARKKRWGHGVVSPLKADLRAFIRLESGTTSKQYLKDFSHKLLGIPETIELFEQASREQCHA